MKKIIIVGGGFGGVSAAKALAQSKNCHVHLIDRRNHHLFQPLLYQVAMAGLNPSDIAVPIRKIFAAQKNIEVSLAEVEKVDIQNNQLYFDETWHSFDYLVLACGAKHFYFGNNQWESVAPGLKNIEQATEIRRRVLTAFEMAEKESHPKKIQAHLTFVIVGGGPTGVELAGAISEMASKTLIKDYKNADLSKTKVILVEAGPRLLPAFPEKLSRVTLKNLEDLGVEVRLNTFANFLTSSNIKLGEETVPTKTIIWAAGVKPSALTETVHASKDKTGRLVVTKDLSLKENKNVFVVGDQSAFYTDESTSLPGIAPVAIQQGHFAGLQINRDLNGQPREQFNYLDKGIMATIGRSKAVVHTAGMNFHGFFAWLMWVVIHIIYLMRFRNRFFVFLQWMWSYFRFGRGARLIVHKTWRFYSGEKISYD